jgi:hypothetical protein
VPVLSNLILRLGLLIHQHMAGLLRHAVEPGADRRERGQIEIAGVREMRIGVERYVRDAVAVGREIAVVLEVILHDMQRAVALFHPVIERVLLQFATALDERQPEIGSADVGLEAALLEEHPLQCLGARDAVLGRKRGAARHVPENRI